MVESNKIHEKIPGGAHTYSKGDDQFPLNAPKFISRGKGAHIWDENDDKFIDLANSLGTTILGHAYEPVLNAVKSELDNGVNFCRPSVVEGELAEKLIDIIPSAEMVKFAKNGSDAVTASIKLARAHTGRDYVARCSSDPFNAIHDWFIGSTVINRGVPKCVSDLTLKFNYNDIESCEKLFSEYPGKIACFILEPLSFEPHKNNFLEKLKSLCEKNGTILIFDEVVSGFRFALGGAQEYLGITPHLSAFGKAMANGFSVSALVGQKEFMKLGGIKGDHERVFLLSTTHGGETHGIRASLATIEEIEKNNAIEHFWNVGERLIGFFNAVAFENGIESSAKGFGFGCKPAFTFMDEKGQPCSELRTLFLQEMIERKVLMPYVVPSLAHTDSILNEVEDAISESLSIVANGIKNSNVVGLINGPIVKPVFRKFN